MTSPKQTKLRAATAGRMSALTEAWKKAFDARIRSAALTRRMPPGRRRHQAKPTPDLPKV